MTTSAAAIKFILCMVCACVTFNAFAQKNEKLLNKASAQYNESKFEQALKKYQKIIDSDPNNEQAILQSGRCLVKLGNYSKANDQYERLIYISDPLDPKLFLEFGDLLMKQGENTKARTYFTNYNNLLEKNDLRTLKYIASIENYENYFKDSTFVAVSPFGLNTPGDDLFPICYEDKVIFVSNSKNLNSRPLTFDLYYNEPENTKSKIIRVGGSKIGMHELKGITVAKSSGECLFIHSIEGKSIIKRAFIEENGVKLSKAKTLEIENFDRPIFEPAINSTGNILVFSAVAENDANGLDLFISKRNSYGYSEPTALPGLINTMGDERFPFLLNDSILLFASNGHGGVGGFDLFYIDLNKPGSLPSNIGYPINSRFDELGITVRQNGKSGYFISDRRKSKSRSDLFSFQIEKIRSWGTVIDKDNGDNLKNVGVDIMRKGSEPSQFMMADNGRFSVTGDPGESYQLSISREGYATDIFDVSTANANLIGFCDLSIGRFPILKIPGDSLKESPESLYLVSSEIEDSPEEGINVEEIIEEEIITEKPIEEDLPQASDSMTTKSPDQPLFRLQIAASRSPLSQTQLESIYNKVNKILQFKEDNWHKYYIGEYNSYFEANQQRKICGVKGAFVVAYRNESKVVLKNAISEVVRAKVMDTPEFDSLSDKTIVERIEIFFALNAIIPLQEDIDKIDPLVSLILANENILVQILGHTDAFGSSIYNLGLGNKRADNIRNILINKGVEARKILIKSFGEENLKKDCPDDDCPPETQRDNRRAEVILYRK